MYARWLAHRGGTKTHLVVMPAPLPYPLEPPTNHCKTRLHEHLCSGRFTLQPSVCTYDATPTLLVVHVDDVLVAADQMRWTGCAALSTTHTKKQTNTETQRQGFSCSCRISPRKIGCTILSPLGCGRDRFNNTLRPPIGNNIFQNVSVAGIACGVRGSRALWQDGVADHSGGSRQGFWGEAPVRPATLACCSTEVALYPMHGVTLCIFLAQDNNLTQPPHVTDTKHKGRRRYEEKKRKKRYYR